MNDQSSTMRNHEQLREARAKLGKRNKRIVFDALAKAGITQMIARFDDEGDSGQITDIDAFRDGALAELPTKKVALWEMSNQDRPSCRMHSLEHAITVLCFDVAACTVELEINERFVDVAVSIHRF